MNKRMTPDLTRSLPGRRLGGLSIIELLVSIAILGLVAVAFIATYATIVRVMQSTDAEQTTAIEVKTYLEDIETLWNRVGAAPLADDIPAWPTSASADCTVSDAKPGAGDELQVRTVTVTCAEVQGAFVLATGAVR